MILATLDAPALRLVLAADTRPCRDPRAPTAVVRRPLEPNRKSIPAVPLAFRSGKDLDQEPTRAGQPSHTRR